MLDGCLLSYSCVCRQKVSCEFAICKPEQAKAKDASTKAVEISSDDADSDFDAHEIGADYARVSKKKCKKRSGLLGSVLLVFPRNGKSEHNARFVRLMRRIASNTCFHAFFRISCAF